MTIDPSLVLKEVALRSSRKFRLEDFCFPEQLAFIKDEAKYSTAVCTRRAGKTVGCAADLIHSALSNPERVSLYITLSRTNAKKLIWPEILKINRIYSLGGTPDNTELSLTFPNGSTVYCSGAKDKSEIEKFRGLAITKAYIDEAASFRPYIEDLIDDVLSAALFDYDGKLRLIGTPGPIPSGFFYKASHSDEWSHHFWTLFQNPHIKRKSGRDPMEMVMAEIKRRGVSIDDPKIQREFFGKWVIDTDSLVFKYDPEINHFDKLPVMTKPWQYIFGVDIGHDDSDAIAVIAWHEYHPNAYLVEELVNNKQGVTELANQIQTLMGKYDPMRIVMDTGGLGKKIAVEMQKRFALPIVAAEKSRKFEFIELLNDAMRTERFFAKKESRFALDSSLVEWDVDKQRPDKKVISDRYHTDIGEATLYGFREALHWISNKEPSQPTYQTKEWFDDQEQKILESLEEQFCKKDVETWGDMGTESPYEDF